ncbi:glutamate--cysteine ligase [Endozoicomonas sp. OPT23]|uniref:glutamate--cysteine ligase n=1 Tax=Endozoicomonas sp. OPT23 TaxID=2072845 RepID=UPI00129AADE1|nr:glutamate--cysteine ligase [Endozoicomonas sp. OPT23]MRI31567.1 glutamate--cysteine ligase [Endozoicomonas sp. OPT23]
MTSLYEQRLHLFQQTSNQKLFSGIRHGIEREGLRVTPDARLSQTEHPEALGKTLTHPYITTDYSEALLEFITPVYCKVNDVLGFLEELHAHTCRNMEGEYLWAGSMPAILEGDKKIPIGRYGSSNPGKMKSVYREGLAHRYGKPMQTIAGIHYNFSLPKEIWEVLQANQQGSSSLDDFQSEGYLALIRNFRRYSWLLMYLFGASPAVDKSFVPEGNNSGLEELDDKTLFLPWATSLRMSDLGYTNNAQSSLDICYNTLPEYVSSLEKAIRTPYEPYEALGVKKDGKYLQLNTNVLQIENEYYSNIRPKRVASRGEKPVDALRRAGVEYIEVRCMDINPFEPLGLSATDAHFLDVFLSFCALHESPEIAGDECRRATSNFAVTVAEGRKPGLLLQSEQGDIALPEWGSQLIDNMMPIAELLDKANDTTDFTAAMAVQLEKLADVEQTPSAKLLRELKDNKQGYIDWLTELSKKYSGDFSKVPMNEERKAYFTKLAQESLIDQQQLEASDTSDFDEFLKNYFEKN